MIHSVDLFRRGAETSTGSRRRKLSLFPRVLLEVNVAGGQGVNSDSCSTTCANKWMLAGVPVGAVNRRATLFFTAGCGIGRLAQIFSAGSGILRIAEKEFSMKLPQLSMGMTQDFPIGIRGRRDAGARGHGDFWRAFEEAEGHRVTRIFTVFTKLKSSTVLSVFHRC